MAFFANADIYWPWLGRPARKAGSNSLHAGSKLLDFVAKLEDDVFYDESNFAAYKNDLMSTFLTASSQFAQGGEILPENFVHNLSREDFEEAGVPINSSDYGDVMIVREAFFKLSYIMKDIHDAISKLNLDDNRRQQAQKVAAISQKWEAAYRLGRVTAVSFWREAEKAGRG